MRKIIILTTILLTLPQVVFAKAYFAGKEEMIANSDIIVVVEIEKVENLEKDKAHGNQKALAVIIQRLKGNPKNKFSFLIPCFFPCAITSVEKGQYIVFLKNGENGLEGANWHYSYRPIKAGKIEWYSSTDYLALKEASLPDVLGDINKTVSKHDKMQTIISRIYSEILKIKNSYLELKNFKKENHKGILLFYGSCPPVDDIWISLHFKGSYWYQLPCRYAPNAEIYIKEINDYLLFSIYTEQQEQNDKLRDDLIKLITIQSSRPFPAAKNAAGKGG